MERGKLCICSKSSSIHPCIYGPAATASEYGRYPPVWLYGKLYTCRDLVYDAQHVPQPSPVGAFRLSGCAERPRDDIVGHRRYIARTLPLKLTKISQMSTSILTPAYNFVMGYLRAILLIDCVQRLVDFRQMKYVVQATSDVA